MDEKRSIQEEYLYIKSLKEYFYKYNELGDEYIEDIKKLLKHIDKNSETRNYFFRISNYYYLQYYTNRNDTLDTLDNLHTLLEFMNELAETCGVLMFLYKKSLLVDQYKEICDIFFMINQYIIRIYSHIY